MVELGRGISVVADEDGLHDVERLVVVYDRDASAIPASLWTPRAKWAVMEQAQRRFKGMSVMVAGPWELMMADTDFRLDAAYYFTFKVDGFTQKLRAVCKPKDESVSRVETSMQAWRPGDSILLRGVPLLWFADATGEVSIGLVEEAFGVFGNVKCAEVHQEALYVRYEDESSFRRAFSALSRSMRLRRVVERHNKRSGEGVAAVVAPTAVVIQLDAVTHDNTGFMRDTAIRERRFQRRHEQLRRQAEIRRKEEAVREEERRMAREKREEEEAMERAEQERKRKEARRIERERQRVEEEEIRLRLLEQQQRLSELQRERAQEEQLQREREELERRAKERIEREAERLAVEAAEAELLAKEQAQQQRIAQATELEEKIGMLEYENRVIEYVLTGRRLATEQRTVHRTLAGAVPASVVCRPDEGDGDAAHTA